MEVSQFVREHLDTYLASFPEGAGLEKYIERIGRVQNKLKKDKEKAEKILPFKKRKMIRIYLDDIESRFRPTAYYCFCIGLMDAVRYGKDVLRFALNESWEYHKRYPRFERSKEDLREDELSRKFDKYFQGKKLHLLFANILSRQMIIQSIGYDYYFQAGINWARQLFAYAGIKPHPAPPELHPVAKEDRELYAEMKKATEERERRVAELASESQS